MEKQDEADEGISRALTVSIPDGQNKQGVRLAGEGAAIPSFTLHPTTLRRVPDANRHGIASPALFRDNAG